MQKPRENQKTTKQKEEEIVTKTSWKRAWRLCRCLCRRHLRCMSCPSTMYANRHNASERNKWEREREHRRNTFIHHWIYSPRKKKQFLWLLYCHWIQYNYDLTKIIYNAFVCVQYIHFVLIVYGAEHVRHIWYIFIYEFVSSEQKCIIHSRTLRRTAYMSGTSIFDGNMMCPLSVLKFLMAYKHSIL